MIKSMKRQPTLWEIFAMYLTGRDSVTTENRAISSENPASWTLHLGMLTIVSPKSDLSTWKEDQGPSSQEDTLGILTSCLPALPLLKFQ